MPLMNPYLGYGAQAVNLAARMGSQTALNAVPYVNIGTSAASLADAVRGGTQSATPFSGDITKLKRDDPGTYARNRKSLDKLAGEKQEGAGMLGALGPALSLAGAIAATVMTGGAAAPFIPAVLAA